MKTVTCKDPKNFKLTKDGSYEVLNETEGYFHIANDKGVTARYANNLFQVIEGDIAAAAPPPPALPARTEQDCIASINSNPLNSVNYITMDMNQRSIDVMDILGSNESSISCGIYLSNGINSLMEHVDDATNYDSDDLLPLKKALFTACIRKRIARSNNCAMVLFSTNVDNNADWEHYYDAMDSMATMMSAEMTNPNSGNTIKVWGLPGHN